MERGATLLICCADAPGIVATVAQFLYGHGANLVHSDQHTDAEAGLFLQRLQWDLESFDLAPGDFESSFAPIASRFEMNYSLHLPGPLPRLALLASKHGHCLIDLLSRWSLGELRAEVPCVISNHEKLRAEVERFGVPFFHFPVTRETKQAQEAKILKQLDDSNVDLVVLARYMQILTDDFLSHYRHRVINIHHSFLPAFMGARPYHRAHERGVKIIGATAHYATSDLDEGPIIEQDVVRVSHRDSVRELIAKGRDLEKVVLARAVHRHLAHEVLVYGNKTVVFD